MLEVSNIREEGMTVVRSLAVFSYLLTDNVKAEPDEHSKADKGSGTVWLVQNISA